MARISVVGKADLEKTSRIDSEYYQLVYLDSSRKLQNVTTVKLSRISKVGDGNHLTIAERFQEIPGVRYLRGQDVSAEMMIEERNQVYIPEDSYEKIERSHVKAGDVLVTIVGANTGLIALAYDVPEKLSASCKLGIARAHSFNPAYLYAFLISRFGQNQIQQAKRGGGQTGLILPDMRNLLVARFPYLEDKIAAVVLNGHETIQRSRNLYAQAEQVVLFELGLQNWEPTIVLNFPRNFSQAARARRLDAEHFQPKYQEMFGRLSASVRLDRLGKLTAYTKGIEVGSPAYTDSGIPFWRVSNLTKHGLDDSNANFISTELYNTLRPNYEPQQGEMLLSKDATPGLAYYLERPIEGIVSSGILRLSLVDSIPPHYLEILLNSLFVQLQIEQNVGGSVIKHWKPSEVRKTLIPRLSDEKEREIAGLVQQAHAARREARALMEKAKRAVEMAIEESEERALQFLA